MAFLLKGRLENLSRRTSPGQAPSRPPSKHPQSRYARQFVRQTFDIIEGENLCAIASAFTFGREDLLPAVFQRIVAELNVEAGGGLEDFKYYLNRHITLDGTTMARWRPAPRVPLRSDESTGKPQSRPALDCLEARWDCGMESAT